MKKKVEANAIKTSLSILAEVFETAYYAFHDGLDFQDIDDVGRIVSLLYDISKLTKPITKECKKLTNEDIDLILKEFTTEMSSILMLIRDEKTD